MASPPRSSDPATRLVNLLEDCVGWLRSPRTRRRPDLPIRVDLVGRSSSPAATAPTGQPDAPATGGTATEAAPASPAHPFGSAVSSTGSKEQREWSFRETVVLRKSRRSSSLLLWAGVGGVAALGLWSVTAPIAETIAVPGKLEPSSTVKDVDSPVPGVVEEVLVKEGQSVTQGPAPGPLRPARTPQQAGRRREHPRAAAQREPGRPRHPRRGGRHRRPDRQPAQPAARSSP